MPDQLTQVPEGSASAEPLPPTRVLIAVTAAWTLAQMSYYAQSQLLGSLMETFDRGETAIGGMFSSEILVFALTALGVAGPLSRISRVRVAVVGSLVLAAANFVAGYTESFEILYIARIMAGCGGGMVGAAGTAAAASSLSPQRVFAIVTVTWGVMAAIQPALMPYVTVDYGASGGFYAMGIATLLILPLCIWLLPPRRLEAEGQPTGLDLSEHPQSLSVFGRIGERLGVRDAPNRAFALTAMVAMAFYEIGQGSVYLFYEQLGFRAGLDSEAIGGIIGLANLTGLIGGVLAAWMGNRYGTIGPIVIGIALNVAAALGLTLSENSVAYFWLNFLWTVAYSFVVPYILGVLSDMDDLGRWVVAMDAVWWLGDAPAPFVGGWLVESGGYSRLAGVPVFTGAVCIVLIVLVLRRFNAQQEQPSGP